MIIVHNITEGNEIRFIPREGYATTAVLTDQVTGESIEEIVDFTRDGYYSLCTINASLVDQRRYNLKIYSYSVMSSYVTRIDSVQDDSASQFIIID